jgi:DNA-binding transcriptional MocR family regulator
LRLYRQIVRQIEESILAGALKAGDQLPAERDDPEAAREALRAQVVQIREDSQVAATGRPERLRTVSSSGGIGG